MLRHLGYVATALTIDASASRTCRLKNAAPERLRALIAANLAELGRIVEFNAEHGIALYRISSGVIPFGSHPVNTLAWWDEFAPEFARLGGRIRALGMRVSMHPGQFTVLNSPDPRIVADSVRELEWHARFLDALDLDVSCKLVLHVGGVYDGKAAALDRFEAVAEMLPAEVRRRLVIENDERLFGTPDVLGLSRRTGLPVVFDWLHHAVYSGLEADPTDLIAACFATWGTADGPPKVHLSSQAADARPGAHADWIDPADLDAFLRHTPPAPFDCMLEAKRKDQALFRLRDHLADRAAPATTASADPEAGQGDDHAGARKAASGERPASRASASARANPARGESPIGG